MQGTGEFLYKDGSKYSGEWQANEKAGTGTLVMGQGGEVLSYTGGFQRDRMSGTGVIFFRDGTEYSGEFSHNAITGQGEIRSPDWLIKGQFDNNQKHGDLQMLKSGRQCHMVFCYDQEKLQYTDFGKRF